MKCNTICSKQVSDGMARYTYRRMKRRGRYSKLYLDHTGTMRSNDPPLHEGVWGEFKGLFSGLFWETAAGTRYLNSRCPDYVEGLKGLMSAVTQAHTVHRTPSSRSSWLLEGNKGICYIGIIKGL